ncbi:MAG: glycosyltransferase family 2 protein [Clostridiales bacterium]|nr:glycosyltransferase family 2 protein [Clostridiales bacterium]
MDKLVSIIVPVYNAGAYIEETIEMVCRQTYTCWELLLVDDCSKDDGKEKIEAFCCRDERIRLIAKEKNEGAALARNTGLFKAEGRYIAFLDADDVWLPEKLEKELHFMEEKKAAFVFSGYEFGDESARGTGKVVKVPETITYREALSRTVIFTSTVIFDTEKIDKKLIEMPLVKSEDTATWWKILRNGYTAYGLNEVLVIYRRPGKSLSSNKLVAIKRIWNLYRKEEQLSLPYSIYNFVLWAFGAVLRRI